MLFAPDYTCDDKHTWPADTAKRKKKCPRCGKPARPAADTKKPG
jgi:hypothetical protein